jgi:hypothetical protein
VLSFRIKCKSQLGYDNEIIRSMSYELFDDDDGNVDISVSQIQRGKRHATDIKIRLLSAVNPNIE